ncbi:MAG TPA: ABC transporter permease [Candidatus Acidoferrales bacterium]
MPDWKQYVREHLPPLELSGAREQEIIEKIAQQLEDVFSESILHGLAPAEAESRAAAQIPDWRALAHEIRRADQPIAEIMNAAVPEDWREAIREENFRKRRGGNFMANFWQDACYAFRVLRNSPGITAVVVLTLALGIGANSAIFSVVNSVLLRPLPYRDSTSLVWVTDRLPKQNQNIVFDADYFAWRNHCTSFQEITAYMNSAEYTLTGAGDAERVAGVRATYSYLRTLGVSPQIGRDISVEEDRPGGPHVVLMSDRLWRARFSADPTVVGRNIALDGNSYTVVGILPPSFEFPENPKGDLLVPFGLSDSEVLANRAIFFVRIIARLKPSVTPDAAAAELDAISPPFHAAYTGGYAKSFIGAHAQVMPLHDRLVGDVRKALLLLLGAVAFVLLIACVNVATLQLARAAAREKEIAIRAAMGAGRWRLARQLLTESTLVGFLGGVAGLLLAVWLVALARRFGPRAIPHLDATQLDGHVVLFTIVVSFLSGILFGLAPVFSAFRVSLNDSLKQGGAQSSAGKKAVRPQQVLVTIELAMALVLFIGAGLLARSFVRLISIPQGFDSHGVLTARISLPASTYLKEELQREFYSQLMERVRALPGVTSAAAVGELPFGGWAYSSAIQVEGRPLIENNPAIKRNAAINPATSEFFTALRIPLKSGRFLDHTDVANAPETGVINETFARKFFPNENPIGHRIEFAAADDPTWRTIVGVVGDTPQTGIATEILPEVYVSAEQLPDPGTSLVLRTDGDPMTLAPAVREIVASLDKNVPLYEVERLDDSLASQVASQRFNMALLAGFAVLALLLSAIGIYGVMAYAVGQRTHEIGIRLALGAVPGNVLRMILFQGAKLAVLGVGLGLGAGIALTRLLSSMLFEVKPTDPLTFAAGALILFAAALAACWIPARRATKVSPLVALRYE